MIGYVVTGTLNLSSQIFMRPRLSNCVALHRDVLKRIRGLARRRLRRHGSGNAVVDLIFSMAKRDVTFFSGMAAISCL